MRSTHSEEEKHVEREQHDWFSARKLKMRTGHRQMRRRYMKCSKQHIDLPMCHRCKSRQSRSTHQWITPTKGHCQRERQHCQYPTSRHVMCHAQDRLRWQAGCGRVQLQRVQSSAAGHQPISQHNRCIIMRSISSARLSGIIDYCCQLCLTGNESCQLRQDGGAALRPPAAQQVQQLATWVCWVGSCSGKLCLI